jgi:hypothetical protein
MSINWEKSPEGATHFHYGNVKYSAHWYKDGYFCVVGFEDKGWKQDFEPSPKDQYIDRPKPKQWSGPQDGLPPVGEQIDIYDEDNHEWVTCKVVYIGVHDGGSAVIGQGDDVIMYGYNNGDIRKPRTSADVAAEQRETAIREIMDIADVDCRVTAARLVDAGFKREVV